MRGYTFIELLVVFSIMAIIGTLGLASFSSFGNEQQVISSANDVATVLLLGRQNVLSHIKPDSCTESQSLTGYQFRIDASTNTYVLEALCDTIAVPVATKHLPANIQFQNAPTTIVFSSPNGTTTPATLTLAGYGKSKQVIIQSTGVISVQ